MIIHVMEQFTHFKHYQTKKSLIMFFVSGTKKSVQMLPHLLPYIEEGNSIILSLNLNIKLFPFGKWNICLTHCNLNFSAWETND